MTGWEATRDTPSSTAHMQWVCPCGATRASITHIVRHQASCHDYDVQLQNHTLGEFTGVDHD
jgi:hypothetical protein